MSILETLNPKTPDQITNSLNQVFWFLVLMTVSFAAKAALTAWLVLQPGIDKIGPIEGTGFSSFIEVLDAQLADLIVLVVALYLFRRRKSFIMALVILAIAAWRCFNVATVYLATDGAQPKLTAMILNPFYLAVAIVGVIATYRWRKLRKAGMVS